METDLTIPIGHPESAGEKALAALAEGYRIIKTKVGVSPAEDLRRLKNIRAAVGGRASIRIDANQGWRRMEAVRTLRALSTLDIEFCEQPVRAEDVEGLRWVNENAPIPVMADEALFSPADALRLVTAGAAPYFNIKLSKSAGILGARKVAHIAEAAGVACMLGCMLESRLGLTAAAHLALAHECIVFFDLDSNHDHAVDPIEGGMTVREGMIEVPDAPGLGARPDPAFLEKCEKA